MGFWGGFLSGLGGQMGSGGGGGSGWGSAAGQGGMLMGGKLWNAMQARKQHQRSLQMQQRQFDFSERMSNTQWQRGVADMRAAGINPLLAVSQGGASSPQGSGGTGAAGQDSSSMDLTAARQAMANIKLMNSSARNQHYQSEASRKIAGKVSVETDIARQEEQRMKKVIQIMDRELEGAKIDEAMLKKYPWLRQLEMVLGVGNSARSITR